MLHVNKKTVGELEKLYIAVFAPSDIFIQYRTASQFVYEDAKYGNIRLALDQRSSIHRLLKMKYFNNFGICCDCCKYPLYAFVLCKYPPKGHGFSLRPAIYVNHQFVFLEPHHIVPRSHGGSRYDIFNQRVLCLTCHAEYHDRDISDNKIKLSKQGDHYECIMFV